MSIVPQCIFVIVGNDGTGKTTIVNQINHHSNFKAIERNSKETFGLDPKTTDRLTFISQWTPEYTFTPVEFVIIENTSIPVFWIVLNCDPKISERRISGRDHRDIFETPKALFYYHRKYLEIAANFGLPVIENGTRPVHETIQEILTIPKYYSQFRQLALLNKDYHDVDDLDHRLWYFVE